MTSTRITTRETSTVGPRPGFLAGWVGHLLEWVAVAFGMVILGSWLIYGLLGGAFLLLTSF